jgi:hypothetical protein
VVVVTLAVPPDTDPDSSDGRSHDLTTVAESVTEAARREFGGALRAVLVYDTDADPALDVHYVRDDVAAAYDSPVREVAAEVGHDDVFVELDRESEGRNPLGPLRGSVRVFESGVVVRFVPEPGRGVSASLERDAFPGVQSFLDAVDGSLSP